MLKTLKLLDPDGTVALTNVVLYTVLLCVVYSVYRSGSVDITALGALLAAVAAYRQKALQGDKRLAKDEKLAVATARIAIVEAENAELRRTLDRLAASPVRSTATLPAGLR